MMEAFPFTDFDEEIILEDGSYVAMTNVGDQKIKEAYDNGVKAVIKQRSGLILP
jgi:hypothetical protein